MKVLVGYSAGVDSTACVILLKNEGFKVTALTLSMCDDSNRDQILNLTNMLSIESEFLDTSDLFHEQVLTYFINSNLNGETPNPCVICNENVKFKALYDYAISHSFDYIATGHYAKVVDRFGSKHISRGEDQSKDQSYVLARVPNEIISKLILPLSNVKREESEVLVADLPTLPTSQDTCFASGDTRRWIQKNIGFGKRGDIITNKGKILGQHEGLLAYTIGQRSGLKLGNGPWYVIERDFQNNILIVGRKSDVMRNSFIISDLRLDIFEELSVMTRYRAKPISCRIDGNIVATEKPVFATTPGQFAVFYVGEVVVGSGVIRNE